MICCQYYLRKRDIMEKLLSGKKGIVFGVANNRSIAWGCAKKCLEEGAEISFSYLGEAQKKRVGDLLADYSESQCSFFPCDLSKDEEIEAFISKVKEKWETVDFVIHSVAYTDRENLKDSFSVVSRESFARTLDISAYSLVAVTKAIAPLMKNGGSIVTMTYLGAEKVIPRYNVMGVAKAALESSAKYLAYEYGQNGIRINCISAGALKTLSSSAVLGIKDMIEKSSQISPLKRSLTQEDVASTALYLLSDLSSGVTGEVMHVDCGYNILGMFD